MNNNGSNNGGSVSSGPSGTSGTHSGPSGRGSNEFSRNGSESKFKPNTSGSQRIFKPIPYSDEDHNRIQLLLDKVLGPEYVSCRPGGGGQKVSYIEGWKALNLANEIFGFNGWNSELISSQVDYFDTHGNTGRFSMGLSVVVRVTIKDGTYHEDFGYGYIDNAKSKAMAFEKCKKEAFTDGVKRCLRCFGNVLGNCLYDRTIIAKIQKVKLPQPEFEDDNFYRDPLLLEREHRKNNSFKMNIMETTRNTNLNYTAGRRNNQQQEEGTTQIQSNPQIQGNPQPNPPNNRPNPRNNLPNNLPNIQPNNQPNNRTNSNESSHLVHKPLPTTSTIDQAVAPTPQKEYAPTSKDLEDLEDSFLFSDEMMEEDFAFADDNEELVTKGADSSNDTKDTSVEPRPPSQFPLFVSAKGASAMQQGSDDLSKLPQFDPKFVSPNIRRTIDPTKSAPVKRSEIAPIAVPSSSQVSKPPSRINPINSSQNTNTTNTTNITNITNSTNSGPSILGKRIGMPPSQRQSKRLHKES
jgi:DNA repair and recombination protein RAD52